MHYAIPPDICSIEWLNQVKSSNPSFIAANDKKIRLFKLNQEILDDQNDSSEGEDDENHSFVK